MNEAEKRITETLAHAKDAAVVLEHIQLKPQTPEEAGVHAEIKAAEASVATAIDSLKRMQDAAGDENASAE